MSNRLRTMFAEKLKSGLKDVQSDLEDLWKVEVSEALEDLGELLLQLLTVSDPQELAMLQREVLHAKARVANWTFVGADKVRARLKVLLNETAEVAGSLLKGIIK